jgi:alpha-ketoglutarate-dependent dioxygenase FTO
VENEMSQDIVTASDPASLVDLSLLESADSSSFGCYEFRIPNAQQQDGRPETELPIFRPFILFGNITMGKGNKRRRNAKSDETQPKSHPVPEPTAVKTRTPHSKHKISLPLPFPPNLPVPKESFLRNQAPYQKSFQAALETSYEGLVVDDDISITQPEVSSSKGGTESIVQDALDTLERHGFFRTDVTQPFGLGTKCAKTYVTRCLLGASGTTYKYLGLRMFAYPWDLASGSGDNPVVAKAVETVGAMNQSLTERSQHHLSHLSAKRQARGDDPCRGRAGFDIALINRMENSSNLKQEPSLGEGKCSVSWHADSSLEHYSTIAVYHTLDQPPTADGAWSVALRVAPHSEGPTASRRGTDIESSIVTETPPIAVSLPSGSVYYLLEDFNHHHQHAVLAEGDAGVRFSSTHRLLRDSHNVSYMLERCKTVCSNFHKKGPKIWRSEQLLLTEMESEWLRQYFIQGRKHNELMWSVWGDSIKGLLQYWSKLETRTRAVVDLLEMAAEGKCLRDDKSGPAPSRVERKLREKRKKAVATLNDILDRDSATTNAVQLLYEPIIELLLERATMRELWIKREHDHAFREMEPCHRPMAIPFEFNTTSDDGKSAKDDIVSKSPMPGSPQDLRTIGDRLEAFGTAWLSGNSKDLPAPLVVTEESKPSATIPASKHLDEDHAKSPTWKGWKDGMFGLELQSPWAEHLLQGEKTIETRLYDLPAALIGRRIDILRSVPGTAGVSSLENCIALGSDASPAPVQRIGWCTFKRVIRYTDRTSFQADEGSHLVKRDSGYAWKDGETKVIFGWVVGDYAMYNGADRADFDDTSSLERRMRSLFEFKSTGGQDSSCTAKAIPGKSGDKRKKKSHDKSEKRKKRY